MNKIQTDIQTLLDLLPIIGGTWGKGGWVLYGGKELRKEVPGGFACPLCALLNEIDCEERWYTWLRPVVRAFPEISLGALYAIADAADLPYHSLRPALLAALGLDRAEPAK